VYAGSGKRAASRLPSVRQYAGDTSAERDVLRLDGVELRQHGAYGGFALGVQQQARAWQHAGDALRPAAYTPASP